jgi:hypothetical protein
MDDTIVPIKEFTIDELLKKYGENLTESEVKLLTIKNKETLEEAAERLSKNAYKKHSVKDDTLSLDEQIQRSGGFIVGFKEGMIASAKWMQERVYSEEEVKEAIRFGFDKGFCSNSRNKVKNLGLSEQEWFEQYKKK